MDILEQLDIHDCPICGGPSLLEETGRGYYVSCIDCGSHSVDVRFSDQTDGERLLAARKAAELWNAGKVIAEGVGE